MQHKCCNIIFALALCFTGINTISAEPLRIVSYNVENLFHPAHDSVMTDSTWAEKDDLEWTPEGERRWSYSRYYRKVESIARVLTNIGEWEGVDIAGLQEVENAACLRKLCYTLRRGEYDFVHYESPDPRGIDVALVYKKARVDTINSRAIRVADSRNDGMRAAKPLNDELKTRDILYVCTRVDKKDTLHLLVCHLPSQRSGTAETEWKRTAVKKVLQGAVDSIYGTHPDAKIIVMGDFNDTPRQDLHGLRNRMVVENQKSKVESYGTHKYHGQWNCLDQFYTSPAIDSLSTVRIYDAEWVQEPDEKYLGLRPKRTFNGFHYQKDGFSDHLPIVMEITN
ncbi:MAG: hypothetical protein II825_04780 [Paludibacteraceae bacterium]|nr:hypothetical protein [Paludibacteraceae bacterium]